MMAPRRVYVWLCALFVSLGGTMFSYEVSSINGIKEMEGFRKTFNISFTQRDNINESAQCASDDDVETSALLGSIVSVFSIGALVGALVSGLLSDLAGRKVAIVIGGCLYALGGTLQASSFYIWMFFPGRIISGIGTGIMWLIEWCPCHAFRVALQACPLYIAEISPREVRGIMVGLLSGIGASGLVAGIAVNAITDHYSFGWRLSLSIQILIGTVLALGGLFIPETPRFLVKKHKDAQALKVLTKVHRDDRKAQSELTEIQLLIKSSSHQTDLSQMQKCFCNWSIVQRVLIGYVLMLMTRITGAPVIV